MFSFRFPGQNGRMPIFDERIQLCWCVECSTTTIIIIDGGGVFVNS